MVAEVYWIHLQLVYDIAFWKGYSIGRERESAIYNRVHPDTVNSTMYNCMNWETTEERETSSAELNLKVAVQIDGETQPCIFAMVSEEEHYFPPARNGVEFIIFDTCSGMSCFNRLRMYDSIDWSKTGNLRTGLQGRPLKVQGVGVSGVVNDIHFCEDG